MKKTIKEKVIIFCYRGSDTSNQIASTTKNYLERLKLRDLDISFINLDKRNISKFVDKDEVKNADRIYIWEEEELLIDLFQDDNTKEIIIYTSKMAETYKDNGHSYKKKYDNIANMIFNEYKKADGVIEVWTIKDLKPVKVIISKYDFEKIKHEYTCGFYNKNVFFDSLEECKKAIINNLEKKKKYCEFTIKSLENRILKYKNDISDTQKLIEEKNKEFSQIKDMEAVDYNILY